MGYQTRDPGLNSTQLFDHVAASVGNPPTGYHKILNRNGKLVIRNSSGVESFAGSGEGGTNYFTNGNFEADATTGVTAGGGTAPTIGTETAAPLFGTKSSKITSGAGTGYVRYAIAGIDNAIIDGQIALGFSGYVETGATAADGDWTIGIYNVTDAVYATEQTDLKGNQLNYHQALFVPITGKTYALQIEFTDTTAGRIILVDSLRVTFENTLITNPEADSEIKVTGGSGHGSTNTRVRRFSTTVASVGSGITFTQSATLGDIFTINESGVYAISYTDGRSAGPSSFGVSKNSSQLTTDIISITNADRLVMSQEVSASGGFTNIGGTYRLNAGDIIRAHTDGTVDRSADAQVAFTISQVEKTDDINLLTPSVINSNAKAQVYATSTATIASGGFFLFDTFQYNVGFAALSSNQLVIPANGYYQISFHNEGSVATTDSVCVITVNGTAVDASNYANGGNEGKSFDAQITMYLTAGQLVGAKWFNSTSPAQQNGVRYQRLEVIRVADISASEPFGFGLAQSNAAGLVPKYSEGQTSVSGANYVNASAATVTQNYLQVGDTVQVFGSFSFTQSGAGDFYFDVTVPIASALTGANTAAGHFSLNSSSEVYGNIYRSAASTVTFRGNTSSSGGWVDKVFSYTYKIN
jgi:hypothetical protein